MSIQSELRTEYSSLLRFHVQHLNEDLLTHDATKHTSKTHAATPAAAPLPRKTRIPTPTAYPPSLSLNRPPEPAKSVPPRPFPPPHARYRPPPPEATTTHHPAKAEEAGEASHGEVHAQEQGLGRGGRHGARRRAARHPHALPHPPRHAAAQGERGRLPRAPEQEAREAAAAAAAAGAQGEGRWAEGAGARDGGGGVRGQRPGGLLRRQRPGLGRHREEYEGDDALQPDQELGDDEHAWFRDKNQQPQDADAGSPFHPELARDGRVLRCRRATATSGLQRQVQLLSCERVPAPRAVRVGEDRLLASSSSSTLIDPSISVHQMTSSNLSCNADAVSSRVS